VQKPGGVGGANTTRTKKYQEKFKRIDDTVLTLRTRGMTYTQIVKESGLTLWDVKRSVNRLIKNKSILTRPRALQHKALVERIKHLRLKGVSYPEIAKQTGITQGHVYLIVSSLIKQGEVAKKRRSVADYKALQNSVKTLRLQNLHYTQIARKLDLTNQHVANIITRLKKQGVVFAPGFRADLPEIDAFDTKVQELLTHGLSPKEISEKAGKPQSRIYHAIHRLVKKGKSLPLRK